MITSCCFFCLHLYNASSEQKFVNFNFIAHGWLYNIFTFLAQTIPAEYQSSSVKMFIFSDNSVTNGLTLLDSDAPGNTIKITFNNINLTFRDFEIVEVQLFVTFAAEMNETCHAIRTSNSNNYGWAWCQMEWKKGIEYQSPNITSMFINELSSRNGQVGTVNFDLTNDRYQLQQGNYSRLVIKYRRAERGMCNMYIIMCWFNFLLLIF